MFGLHSASGLLDYLREIPVGFVVDNVMHWLDVQAPHVIKQFLCSIMNYARDEGCHKEKTGRLHEVRVLLFGA